MNAREHASLARALIAASGGLEEAAGACRVRKTELSRYQTPHEPTTMPADVICALELYCGEPIYSRALLARFTSRTAGGDLKDAAACVTEAAADLQGRVRAALADGALTPREADELRGELVTLDGAIAAMTATLRGAEGGA